MWNAASQVSATATSALERADCLALLARCKVASLACTVNALPTVIPVGVHAVSGGLRVAVPPDTDGTRLCGQIVAFGAVVPITARSDGWWVIVRGELRPVAGVPNVLALEAFEIDGRALSAAPPGGWWRC